MCGVMALFYGLSKILHGSNFPISLGDCLLCRLPIFSAFFGFRLKIQPIEFLIHSTPAHTTASASADCVILVFIFGLWLLVIGLWLGFFWLSLGF